MPLFACAYVFYVGNSFLSLLLASLSFGSPFEGQEKNCLLLLFFEGKKLLGKAKAKAAVRARRRAAAPFRYTAARSAVVPTAST